MANVNATTVAGRELEHMSSASKSHLVATLDKSLNTNVNKFFWVMCDEKWFHGLVPRANAKACAELGIEKETYSAHHKKHIAKVMVDCTVAY